MDNAAILTVASRLPHPDAPLQYRLQSVIVVHASPRLGSVLAAHAATATLARRLVNQPFGIAAVHGRPQTTPQPNYRRIAITEPACAHAYRDPMRSCRLPDAIRDRTAPATDDALRAALADTWIRARRIHPARYHYLGIVRTGTGTVSWSAVDHPAAAERTRNPLETRHPDLQAITADHA